MLLNSWFYEKFSWTPRRFRQQRTFSRNGDTTMYAIIIAHTVGWLKNSFANPAVSVVSVLLVWAVSPPLPLGYIVPGEGIDSCRLPKKSKKKIKTQWRRVMTLHTTFNNYWPPLSLRGNVIFIILLVIFIILRVRRLLGHHSSWRSIVRHPLSREHRNRIRWTL